MEIYYFDNFFNKFVEKKFLKKVINVKYIGRLFVIIGIMYI